MEEIIIIILISLLTFGQLKAQIITDRPDQTESSSTVGNGNLQIESGLLIGFEFGRHSQVYVYFFPDRKSEQVTFDVKVFSVNHHLSY